MVKTPHLPAPGADALAHSERLCAHIEARIAAAGGWIDFAEYMNLALYAPGLGYYSAGSRKFGAAGDFVTAPEIGGLFGAVLSAICAEVLEDLGGSVIIEAGAGTGALAAALLEGPAGAAIQRYVILEPSADLRHRQQRALAARVPGSLGRVEWLDGLPQAPLSGLLIANEVLDALPVARFRRRSDGVDALGVCGGPGGLRWATRPAPAALEAAVRAIEADLGQPLPTGYESEINLQLEDWLAGLAAMIDTGLMVFIDYGHPRREYYHPERSRGTLACHYRQRFHDDPFFLPGLQDISAWVDFTAVARAAAGAGLALEGYGSQAHFLSGPHLERVWAGLPRQGVAAAALAHEARQLLLPGAMGEAFKVMLLGAGGYTPPGDYLLRDLSHSL